ncbi:hypothetical protein NA57DRAFT_33482 [Rhizodiscina lignyota]|uniref:Tubulin gamma chain n=1 Tax=Rhizodiscina lignyota TaxID=1504668 RepID=A0A9P4IMN3_9PEZI|nr:hypothetical protein NA57DRAFT_33482 [Rhizodiscina lignyota]
MASKKDIIEERKANLPLPDDPPVQSDWNSADARTVNVGSGGQADDISYGAGSDSMRGPATGTNVAGGDVGRTAKDNLSGLPNDAVTREAKNKPGLADTTGPDYGYPQKSDPSSGLK